ncbi:uncharacterized protein LOC123512011 [Portunus trituberculatus]|uniref:uncharacterized protein LOC123512011 n=1 Tax=Portunus trituberculatus TaxID=210409 RepID=UPI001E1D084D|nr:uncharacterized protein LOC123512011 [Portunus trituberculatus]
MAPCLFLLLLLLLLLLATLQGSVEAIRIVEMQVPPTVEVGKTVHLACRFDPEGAKLYSLNWWRGSDQFFQYSPSSADKIIVYDSPGITVDKKLSGRETVVLRNISHASAGRFKCEVLADYPSFEKHSEATSMEVIDVPTKEPKVSLHRLQWSPGEVLRANCTAPPVRPPSNLHWYINGKKVSQQKVRTMVTKERPESRMSVEGGVGAGVAGGGQQREAPREEQQLSRTSQLTLALKAEHFTAGGQATLACEASLSGMYSRVTKMHLALPGYKTAAPSQKLFGGGARMAAGGGVEGAALLLGLLLLLQVL